MDENADNPSESDLKKIEKVLKEVNNKKPSKVRKKPKTLSAKDKQRLGTAIASSLSEFIDCYILIGYDVNGNSLVLINSQNNLESRGLSDLLEDFMTTGSDSLSVSYDEDDDPEDSDEDFI
jgi:hypothetical protein